MRTNNLLADNGNILLDFVHIVIENILIKHKNI